GTNSIRGVWRWRSPATTIWLCQIGVASYATATVFLLWRGQMQKKTQTRIVQKTLMVQNTHSFKKYLLSKISPVLAFQIRHYRTPSELPDLTLEQREIIIGC